MLKAFQQRMVQVHVSEVNSSSQHDPVSYAAQIAFREVSNLIPTNIPLIVESRVNSTAIGTEIRRVREALPEPAPARAVARAQVCHPYV